MIQTTHLILTRHGETLENRQGIMQGHMPGTLSPLGIQQARDLADRLKEEKWMQLFAVIWREAMIRRK